MLQGEIPINVLRNRESTFEPQAIPKRTRDVSGIEDKVLSMYAKGMSQRDIASTIEDIYGFNISAETISEITDKVLEEGAKAIFKNVVVQRCIVHLIRNSIKYVPSKSYKPFTAQLKKVYGAPSLKAAEAEFEKFKQTWNEYPGAVDVWTRNWKHVEQLFNYGSAVRKVMYTTNAIESVNSSFRKVTKRESFPNENALFKLLYLRVTELYKKWKNRPVGNWAMVRNQLSISPEMQSRVALYEHL